MSPENIIEYKWDNILVTAILYFEEINQTLVTDYKINPSLII